MVNKPRPGSRFEKPKPTKARPKPELWSWARPDTSLLKKFPLDDFGLKPIKFYWVNYQVWSESEFQTMWLAERKCSFSLCAAPLWSFLYLNLWRSRVGVGDKVARVWVWTQWTGSWPWPDPQFRSWKGQGQRGSQIVWFMVQGYGIYSDPVQTCLTQFWTYNMSPFVANEY